MIVTAVCFLMLFSSLLFFSITTLVLCRGALNIGALIIRIGFWGPLYYNHNKEHQNSIGNYSGPYIRVSAFMAHPARVGGKPSAPSTTMSAALGHCLKEPHRNPSLSI